MPLPTISAVKPLQVDAQPAVAFDDAFLKSLIFEAPSPTDKWQLSISCQNFNASTGQLGPAETGHSTQVGDVAAYAAQYPVFAQCLGAVLTVAGLVQTHKAAELALMDAVCLLDTDPTRADKVAAAQAALSAARTALGATS
jgi:hypothetical protein